MWSPTAAKAMEATHPHWLQSGWPPNWQGVMRVWSSAEMVSVVRAKMHSFGLWGGC